jgi:hypothetical protein
MSTAGQNKFSGIAEVLKWQFYNPSVIYMSLELSAVAGSNMQGAPTNQNPASACHAKLTLSREDTMRTMIRITMPVEAGNKGIQEGTLQKTIMEALERLKPEAAYFLPDRGLRSALFVADLKDPSDIPGIVEPFFSKLNAAVELIPVMNAEDLKKGLAKI